MPERSVIGYWNDDSWSDHQDYELDCFFGRYELNKQIRQILSSQSLPVSLKLKMLRMPSEKLVPDEERTIEFLIKRQNQWLSDRKVTQLKNSICCELAAYWINYKEKDYLHSKGKGIFKRWFENIFGH